jgi:tRNA1Val (adenine37-N6)-methyltransferase
METATGELTEGHLLAGRVRYVQPRHGFRSSLEPVLLAAAIPARSGQRVLEGGSGAGATLLCLTARVGRIQGLGIEQDPCMVEIARRNAAINDWPNLRFRAADVTAPTGLGLFDHACANPPYHIGSGTQSPAEARRIAKAAEAGTMAAWAAALARWLRPRGTLTFVVSPAALPAAMGAFAAAGCTPTAALPLWPKDGQPAKLLLLQGVRGGRTPFRLRAGTVLHTENGDFTMEAQRILREGAALEV